MRRLIEAGLFLDNLSGRLESMKDYDAVKDVINNMPIAYDPEKVIAQLKEDSYTEVQDDMDPFNPSEVVNLKSAIEIVRSGGIIVDKKLRKNRRIDNENTDRYSKGI